jgi:hypothetical protein
VVNANSRGANTSGFGLRIARTTACATSSGEIHLDPRGGLVPFASSVSTSPG